MELLHKCCNLVVEYIKFKFVYVYMFLQKFVQKNNRVSSNHVNAKFHKEMLNDASLFWI